MAFLDFLPWRRARDPLPPSPSRTPMRDALPTAPRSDRTEEQKIHHEIEVPKGVELSALWEDPNDAGNLPLIISSAAAVLTFVTLIVLLFKK